jgi:hypothetical protein
MNRPTKKYMCTYKGQNRLNSLRIVGSNSCFGYNFILAKTIKSFIRYGKYFGNTVSDYIKLSILGYIKVIVKTWVQLNFGHYNSR